MGSRIHSVDAMRIVAVGVYVVHPPVLTVLEQLADRIVVGGSPLAETIGWHLAFTPATFLGALGVYLAVHRLGVVEIGGLHFPRLPRLSRLSGRARDE